MKRSIAPFAAAATVAVVVTGCASDTDSTARPVPTVTVTETVTAEPPPVAEPGAGDQDEPPLDGMSDPEDDGTMHGEGGEPGESRENPAAAGDTLALGDWDVVIDDVHTGDEARDLYSESFPTEKMDENIGDGNVVVTMKVSATRAAPVSGQPQSDLRISWFSPDGVEVGEACSMLFDGDVPDWLTTGEAFEGAEITGRDCRVIPDEALDGGLLTASDAFDGRMFVDVS